MGAWLRKYYEITGNREDIVQKTELYRTFLEDTKESKTQKAFCDDLVKCNICERKTNGHNYYYGLIRKQQIMDNE